MWTIAISLALLGLATVVSAYLARNTRASTPFDTTRLVSTWNPPAKKRALVLYTPGFTTVTRHIAMAAGRALSSVGYDVTTAAARPGVAPAADDTDLLVVVAPTHFGRLARAAERAVTALRPLPCTRTVAITAGAPDEHALNRLSAALRRAGAAVIAGRAYSTTVTRFDWRRRSRRIDQVGALVTQWVTDVVHPMPATAPWRVRASTPTRRPLVPATPPTRSVLGARTIRRAVASTRDTAQIDVGIQP
jgi:hypothetical protein